MFNRKLKANLRDALYEIECLKTREATLNKSLYNLTNRVELQGKEVEGLPMKFVCIQYCIQHGHDFTIDSISQIKNEPVKNEPVKNESVIAAMKCNTCGHKAVRDATPAEIKAWEILHPSK